MCYCGASLCYSEKNHCSPLCQKMFFTHKSLHWFLFAPSRLWQENYHTETFFHASILAEWLPLPLQILRTHTHLPTMETFKAAGDLLVCLVVSAKVMLVWPRMTTWIITEVESQHVSIHIIVCNRGQQPDPEICWQHSTRGQITHTTVWTHCQWKENTCVRVRIYKFKRLIICGWKWENMCARVKILNVRTRARMYGNQRKYMYKSETIWQCSKWIQVISYD